MTASSVALLSGILFTNCWRPYAGATGHLRPKHRSILPMRHAHLHLPHPVRFSAYSSSCPCMSNLQPQLSDEEVADLMRSDVALPSGPIIKVVDKHGNTKYYPADYGNSCKAWDQVVDPKCDQKFPPARCSQRWCFVNSDCAKRDTHRSMVFYTSERYVSYEACGSFDAQQAYKCHSQHSGKSCSKVARDPTYPAGGQLCEWSTEVHGKALRKSKQVCHPERCRCTGQHVNDNSDELYGSQCAPWDRKKCEEWQNVPDAKIGIWCCQSWCYVDASCPSAAPSSTPGLYWSYAACAEDPEFMQTCPWKEPIGWQGSPVTLSDEARHVLKDGHKTTRAKTEEEQHHSTFDPLLDELSPVLDKLGPFGEAIAGSGFLLLFVCLICLCCLCWGRNSSSDETAPAEVPPTPPAPPPPPVPVATSSERPQPAPQERPAPVADRRARGRSRTPPAPPARTSEEERRDAEAAARQAEDERREAEAAALRSQISDLKSQISDFRSAETGLRRGEEERRAAEGTTAKRKEAEAAELRSQISELRSQISGLRSAEAAVPVTADSSSSAPQPAPPVPPLPLSQVGSSSEAVTASSAPQPKEKGSEKPKPRPKPKTNPF